MKNEIEAITKTNVLNRYEINTSDDSIILETINVDVLNRNKKLNQLIKLLNTIDNNKIISIDGDWGSGKTVFVKQLEMLSKDYEEVNLKHFDEEEIEKFKDNYFVYYYNAWENDFHHFPILSIIYKIINDFPVEKGEVLRSKNAIPGFLNNITSILTSGIVNINEEMNFESLVQEIRTSEEVKKCLNSIIDNLLAEQKNRMIIIIDELDRCNPNFAVKTLEAIKQFYSSDKIVFIVSTNNEQLCNTICKHYGEKFNALSYLNKFYDLVVSLDNSEMKNYLKNHLKFEDASGRFAKVVPIYLVEKMGLGYRETNSYVSTLKIIDAYYNKTSSYFDYRSFIKYIIVPYALALKATDIQKYNGFIKGKGGTEFINTFVGNKRMEQIIIRNLDIGEKNTEKSIAEIMMEVYNSLTTNKKDYRDEEYNIDSEVREELLEVLSLISFI